MRNVVVSRSLILALSVKVPTSGLLGCGVLGAMQASVLHAFQPLHVQSPRTTRSPAVKGGARMNSFLIEISPRELVPATDIESAIQIACTALSRTATATEEALAAKLRSHWYTTASDLAEMSDGQALALGVPLRLRDTVAQSLAAAPLALQGRPTPDGAASSLSAVLENPAALCRGAGSEAEEDSGGSNAELTATRIPPPAGVEEQVGAGNGSGRSRDVEEEPGWEALPIEQRVCPSLSRKGFKFSAAPKASKRGKATKYALAQAELTPQLREELGALFRFNTQRFFGAQAEPILPVTAQKYQDHLRGMLGWQHREGGVAVQDLSLRRLVPSAARAGVAPAFDYVQWLSKERGISVRTQGLVLRAVMAAAKFLYHGESEVQAGTGDKPYSDLEAVKELRALCNAARKVARVAARSADETCKWLEWPDYLAAVRELRRECAGVLPSGRPRPRPEVAWSLQRYLIFAILSCVPDRQRTLRELELGRTLVREEGRWLIKHGPADYKTGGSYGERPPLVIAPAIYPELEAFIEEWRNELQPTHALLFTQQDGKPLTDKSLYQLFWKTSYRLTGRRLNPHLVRDSIVTYLRGGNASERELEALALYMGHSMDMQRSSYDRRTKREKVEPAVALLEALNERARRAPGT